MEGSIVCGAVAAAKYDGGTPQEVPPGSFDTGVGDETEGAEVPDGAGDAEVAAETEGTAEAGTTLDDGPGPAQAATATAMTSQQPRILRMRRL